MAGRHRLLDYLDRLGVPKGLVSDVALLRAYLLIGKGDREAAAQASPGRADAGHAGCCDPRTGLMDADVGECGRAGPALRRLLFTPRGEELYSEPRPWLALSRCLRVVGDDAGAARAAQGAADRTTSDHEERYANWLAAAASNWQDEELVESLSAGTDIWAALAQEQKEATAFSAELSTRETTTWEREP